MIIDLICIVLLVLAIYKGIQKGLIVAAFSFLGIIIGMAAALKLSAIVAGALKSYTHMAAGWIPFAAFLLTLLGVWLLVRMGAAIIQTAFEIAFLGWFNKLAGIILYAALYLTIFSILLFYANKLQLLESVDLGASKTYSYLQPIGPAVIKLFSNLLPMMKGVMEELTAFFERLVK
jgi:membrane protein required for colicin V production